MKRSVLVEVLNLNRLLHRMLFIRVIRVRITSKLAAKFHAF